ncbi:MAG: DNA (cytosine-5-)-methyltransferase [Verrucomicrobiales bacterium]
MPREPHQAAGVDIDQAAAKLGESADTIRRWAKKGLVRSSRDEKQQRVFNLAELERAQHRINHGSSTEFKTLVAKEKSRYRAIELFSGCGGMALGFENAGIQSELLVEWDRHACATLRQNWPDKNLIEGDVGEVDFGDYAGEIDIVAGGFPCQSFSYAGEGRGFADIRGTMFFQFARCVEQVRPKIALGENVRGLLKHDDGRTLATMLEKLSELGYRSAVRVLRAQFHDVPQKRERLIILAVRDDIQMPILFPREKEYSVTLRDALRGVPDSPGQDYPEKKRRVLELVKAGGYWRDLPDDIQREYMGGSYHLGGGKTGMARRLAWDEPSLTLTCSPAQKQTERCHPDETRPLTVREYARIQSFPDSWAFTGPVGSQYKQIGNAVPVNLAYHLGCSLRQMLDGGCEGAEFIEAHEASVEAQMSLRLPDPCP